MAIPNITDNQALELLIELGIQKLKDDYMFMITYCDFISKEKLSNKFGYVLLLFKFLTVV